MRSTTCPLTEPTAATSATLGLMTDPSDKSFRKPSLALVRCLAGRAGLNSAGQLTPHKLRYTFATTLDDASVLLQASEDAIGHADPQQTRRYMAIHQHLDRHAAYALATPHTGRSAPGYQRERG